MKNMGTEVLWLTRSLLASTCGRLDGFRSYPFYFHTFPNSFAHFCTLQKPNSFLFKRFRTLWQKYRGVGTDPNRKPLSGSEQERPWSGACRKEPLAARVEQRQKPQQSRYGNENT